MILFEGFYLSKQFEQHCLRGTLAFWSWEENIGELSQLWSYINEKAEAEVLNELVLT